MDVSTLEALLRTFWKNGTVERVSDLSFLLKLPPPHDVLYHAFVSMVLCDDPSKIHSLKLSHRIGFLASNEGLLDLLEMNIGGANGGPYYFGVERDGGVLSLYLLTTTAIIGMSREDVKQSLLEFMTDPLILRKWEPPSGIQLFSQMMQ